MDKVLAIAELYPLPQNQANGESEKSDISLLDSRNSSTSKHFTTIKCNSNAISNDNGDSLSPKLDSNNNRQRKMEIVHKLFHVIDYDSSPFKSNEHMNSCVGINCQRDVEEQDFSKLGATCERQQTAKDIHLHVPCRTKSDSTLCSSFCFQSSYEDSSSSSDDISMQNDCYIAQWLRELRSTKSTELETMSILYAKSIFDPFAVKHFGSTRVAIGALNVSTNEHDMEECAGIPSYIVDSISHDKARVQEPTLLIMAEAPNDGDLSCNAEKNKAYECHQLQSKGYVVPLLSQSPRHQPKVKTTALALQQISNVRKHVDTNAYAQIAGILDRVLLLSKELNDLLLRIFSSSTLAAADKMPTRLCAPSSSIALQVELCDRVRNFITVIELQVCGSDNQLRRYYKDADFATTLVAVEEFHHFVNQFTSDVVNDDERRFEYSRPTSYLPIITRRMLARSTLALIGVICGFLRACDEKDRFLPLALEHLTAVLLLFRNNADGIDEEMCIEAIKLGALDRAVIFCRAQLPTLSSPAAGQLPSPYLSVRQPSFLLLLFRFLTVLCSTSKGCLQLLTIGGVDVLDVILNCTQDSGVLDADTNDACSEHCDVVTRASVELFAQLTASFVHGSSLFLGLLFDAFHYEDHFLSPPLLPRCVQRLLQLVDGVNVLTESSERLIFCCVSTLDNICRAADECDDSLLETEVVLSWSPGENHSFSKRYVILRLLYEYNAPPRLIRAGTALLLKDSRHDCTSISMQEYIINIFSRMAAIGYIQSLIRQKVIPFLLQVLLVFFTSYNSSTNATTEVSYNVSGFAQRKGFHRRRCRFACLRAATCLVQLTRNSAGLKALAEVQGASQLARVLIELNIDETNAYVSVAETATLKLICNDLLQRLSSFL